MAPSKPSPVARTLALDLASVRTGWAVFEEEALIAWGVIETKGRLPRRLHQLYEQLEGLVETWHPKRIVIEDPFFQARHAHAMPALFACRGIALLVCEQAGCEAVLLRASRVKQVMTGNGRAPKEAVLQAVELKFGITIGDEDIADAIALGWTEAGDRWSSSGSTQASGST